MRNSVVRAGLSATSAAVLALTLAVSPALVGCSGSQSGDTGAAATATQASSDTLAAPSNFQIDFSTGDFSFDANDEGVGYYFVRLYPVKDGQQQDEYIASSSRINGGDTGQKSGNLDLSKLSYGQFNFNLVSNAASGTDKQAPDTQTYTYNVGKGCTMETPEFLAVADGGELDLSLDFWTLSDWYDLQFMPQVEFDVYSDAACTQQVASQTYDCSSLEPTKAMGPASSGHIWPYSADGTHLYLQPASGGQQAGPMAPSGPVELTPEVTFDSLDAGTYYVTAVAKGDPTFGVNDSAVSDPVQVEITGGAATGEFTAYPSSHWVDPEFTGMPKGESGQQTDRPGAPTTQTVTGELVS